MSLAANDRRIRKLSLKVSESSHVYGAASRIEEAFRLVSLPGENEGRHYYFRSLNLGKIRRSENVTLLTLRLQREFQRLMSQAVHAEDPRAPASFAVYFQSTIGPLRYALRRIALGLPLDAWFLRSAVPDFQLPASRAGAVQSLLETSVQGPAGQVSTAHLLAELHAHGELEPLLPLLTVQAAEEFLSAFTCGHVVSPQVSDSWAAFIEQALPRAVTPQIAEAVKKLLARGEFESLASLLSPAVAEQILSAFYEMYAAPPLPVAWTNLIQKAVRLWSTNDPRTLWLTVSALVAEAPARISDPELIYKAQAVVLRVADIIPPSLPLSVGRREKVAGTSKSLAPKKRERQKGEARSSAVKAGTPEPIAEQLEQAAVVESRHEATRTQSAPEKSAAEENAPATNSPFAGFYFLLHVLRHLGIAEFLEAAPKLLDVNFPWILLRALAARAGIAEDDPILGCAAEVPDHERKFTPHIPAVWAEIFPKAQFHRPIERTAQDVARLWVVAVHRWLWRFGELRIADVVRRPGAVSYARPQLDITLLLRGVDIRIRRLGLDVDPAWVAWLGLIVRFHYEHKLGDSYATGNN